MNALISGSAGRALLLDADGWKSFEADDPSTLAARQPADFAYLFGELQDLRALENTDIESVQKELKYESDSALALELALISLDCELPDDIRKEAIEGLDELLSDSKVVERLENTLYARPLPEDADLRAALELSKDAGVSPVFVLLQTLRKRERFIYEVSNAWDAIPAKIFGDHDRKTDFLRVAVREGLFRWLVVDREAGKPAATFQLNAGLNSSITQLRNYREVLLQWTASFRETVKSRPINTEIDEELGNEVSPRRKRGRRVGFNRAAMFREVTARKAEIVSALKQHDLPRISQLVDNLLEYQRAGEPVHAAKSLCDLAMEAKVLGMFALQLELSERSIGIAPNDGWSWAQYGDALLNINRLDEAIRAFEQAKYFRAGAVAENGRAEVLRAKGLLDDALAAYNEVIELHPGDVVARTGRAEVLKAKGLLDDALAAYNEVIELHPENVVARNGRAEVLKAKGLLDDALAAYNEVIELHPENVVARNGRAEVLKAKGLLDDSLAAYREVIELHPENVVAKSGWAEVLKAKGLLHDSLAVYTDILIQFPYDGVARNGRACILGALGRLEEALQCLDQKIIGSQDWVRLHIRAMVLLKMNRKSEAIQILNEGLQNCPSGLQRDYFRTALVIAWLRRGDLAKAKEKLEEIQSPQLHGTANVLRLHVFGAEGNVREADLAFQSLAGTPLYSIELTQELRSRFLMHERPRHDDEWIKDQEVDLVLAA
jgi:tetratricopeptide (TPR) repeat protein